jgi:uncharacterized protein
MDPISIIEKFYDPSSKAYRILLEHSQAVCEKALSLAQKHSEYNFDLKFIEQASLIHDIGIFMTNAPELDCKGSYPYICHGFLGCEIITQEGFHKQALVCERHTGTGLSLDYIKAQNLPLPHREFQPISMEEQLICFADKLYSKSQTKEKTVEEARHGLSKHGTETILRFDEWCNLFL